MTAATYVGSASGGAAATTLTCAAPTGVVSGDHQLAIVCLEITGESITAVPSGWTLLMRIDNAVDSGDSQATAIYTSTTATGSSSWTKNGSRSGYVVRLAWRGGDGLNAATDSGTTRAAATSVALPSITTVQPDSLVIGVIHVDDETGTASTFTPPSGWTERFDSSGIYGGERHSVGVFEIEKATAGAQTGNVGHSRSKRSTVWAIALDGVLAQTVSPAGVSSGEAVGTPTLVAGAVGTNPGGVPSAEAVGVPQVVPFVNVVAVGIPTAEVVGSPTLTIGGVLAPTGVPSGEAVGTPTVAPGPASTSPGGVPSAEAVGTPALTLTVTTAGVPSAEAVGTPALTLGPAEVVTAGVPSGEVVPAPAVTAGPISASATGIPSAEVVPAPRVSMSLFVAGIPSQAAVGTPQLTVGAIAILLVGVDSAEAVGTPEVTVTLDPTQRIRPVRARVVPLYEVIVVGRVPAQAGPPTFLEVDPIDWSKITWSSTLSRPQTLSVTCKTSTITEPIAQRLRAPDRLPTELWVSRNGRRVFAGPLLGGGRNGDELTLQCGGLLTYLQWMIVAADMRFDQVDQFGIAASLIDQWQALDFGHFGIDTSTVGVSGVLRDRSYVRDEIHQVSRRVEELGAVRDGFDAEVDPTTRKLQLWYPGKGVDRSTGDEAIVFDGTNIDDQNAMFSVAPGDLASDAFGTGSKAGGETSLWSEQSNAELRAAFGRSAVTGSWSDVEEQGTLDGKVGGLLDARDQPLRAPGRKVRVPADADLDAYSEGDIVTYEIDDLLGIGGAYRIRSRTVAVEQTGLESVDLEFV